MPVVVCVILRQINAMEIVGSESGVAFRTLAASGVESSFQTLHTEHVMAFAKYGILAIHFAGGARQFVLKTNQLLIIYQYVKSTSIHLFLPASDQINFFLPDYLFCFSGESSRRK